MNEIPLILLIIFSAFTMNLTLQCALGLKGIASSKNNDMFLTLIRLSLIFLVIIILWIIFYRIIFSISSGILSFILLFPISFIIYEMLEYLLYRYILKKDIKNDENYISFPGGITAVAVFICLNISKSFIETFLLSFGFSAGIFIVLLIVKEIRKRAALENVPYFLRGKPLVLITMGILSLVFSVTSLIFIKMINF
jgi:electron transport complex protein RnfA